MISNKTLSAILLIMMTAGCGGGGGGSGSGSSNSAGSTPPAPSGPNALTVTVNGGFCASNTYPNKPCVSITVCTPGTSNCQTINDILLDIGSSGLRIFKQVLTSVAPAQITAGGGSLAECIQFADGTALWGPVQSADVILNGEPTVTVPIHVIDASFGNVPSSCSSLLASPADAKFNGILGVGLFDEDCGSACASTASNNSYYSCSGTTCTGSTAPLGNQVRNPVALLPVDNNGVLVTLPAVPQGGAPLVNGEVRFGIGTRANNTPSSVTALPTDQQGDFITAINGKAGSAFMDTGSNGLFFNENTFGISSATLPACSSPNTEWYCPSSTLSFTATNTGAGGAPSSQVTFQIGNAIAQFRTSNNVFSDIGGTLPSVSSGFDWGMPFFFGRSVFIGISGKTSTLGTGPYCAY
ncbi:MAG TPA: DUF3443 domain-containing protein [Geobacteraceae bacterium]|nr:DUF3443 domain-containing protein [Geobacteraceae bacterium]